MSGLAPYVVAFFVYVGIGVAVPDFLYSSVVAAAFLVVVVWAIPEGLRRLRARAGRSA